MQTISYGRYPPRSGDRSLALIYLTAAVSAKVPAAVAS
jgi:hypothetical protein